jgi:hypothetical protein
MFHYTGMVRYTKDLDLFLPRSEEARARSLLAGDGWATHVHEPTWLSKAFFGDTLVDLIHGSGNGLISVDESWLERGVPARVLGEPTQLVPPEEMIWSKAFVQERDRWDGADVAHLVRALGHRLDWDRLLARFGDDHGHVLLAHLLLFSFTIGNILAGKDLVAGLPSDVQAQIERDAGPLMRELAQGVARKKSISMADYSASDLGVRRWRAACKPMPPPRPTSRMAMMLPVPYPSANRFKPKATPRPKPSRAPTTKPIASVRPSRREANILGSFSGYGFA